MSAYVEDNDDPSASLYVSRAPGNSSSGRPFLSMLNPMGRSYAGYRHPSDVVEEEDEDKEGTIHMTSTQHQIDTNGLGRTNSTDTALDDADEVPASLMIETDRLYPHFLLPGLTGWGVGRCEISQRGGAQGVIIQKIPLHGLSTARNSLTRVV